MKKLLVILMSLLVLLSVMPLCVAAEENTTEAATESVTEPVTEASTEASTDASTEEETYRCTCPNCVVEEETTEVEGPKMTFGFFPQTLMTTLPIMGMGMLGIFLVILVIVLTTVLLNKLGNLGKKNEEES